MSRSLSVFALALMVLAAEAVDGQAPQTHQFVPKDFYATYSFAHPPALRGRPGDRVVTKTIDASGVDWNGQSVAAGANPETGPFYVEGAEPGDMLVVRFDRIETNRATGYSNSLLAPYTLDPAAINARVDREPKRLLWNIDKARGTVWIDSPDLKPAHLEVPIKPMLGCIGVAPARKESITATTPGPWGGNMDYAGVNAGVTIMLPVNEPGALLFIGDGHARMGSSIRVSPWSPKCGRRSSRRMRVSEFVAPLTPRRVIVHSAVASSCLERGPRNRFRSLGACRKVCRQRDVIDGRPATI
jgi:hypothetical protein